MDPNATLEQIEGYLKADVNGVEVDYLCDVLLGWLRHGGFAPDWTKYPLATSYYDCFVANCQRLGC